MTNWRKNSPAFALFWENSVLNSHNIITFSENMERDSVSTHNASEFLFSSSDIALDSPKDTLNHIFESRQSVREFTDEPLTKKDLGALFSGFKAHKDGKRMVPSGGGKYPVEVFAMLFRAEGELSNKIVYYNADNHSLSIIKEIPSWAIIAPLVGLPDTTTSPAMIVVFVGMPSRSVIKYGDRGGRFFLMEVGMYAEHLGLRLASSNAGGYMLGGLFDEEIKKIIGIEKTEAVVALGYACGKLNKKKPKKLLPSLVKNISFLKKYIPS